MEKTERMKKQEDSAIMVQKTVTYEPLLSINQIFLDNNYLSRKLKVAYKGAVAWYMGVWPKSPI